MRANVQTNRPSTPSGNARAMPPARTSPPPATISTLSKVNVSRTGMRRRIGPPGSHMQVLSAASAASMSGGQWKYSFSAMMTATDSAARRPSARLSACRFRLADSARRRATELSGHGRRQAAFAIPRST